MAAELTSDPGVMAGHSAELTEVRWVSLEEGRALMGDMADPVRRYLQQALRR